MNSTAALGHKFFVQVRRTEGHYATLVRQLGPPCHPEFMGEMSVAGGSRLLAFDAPVRNIRDSEEAILSAKDCLLLSRDYASFMPDSSTPPLHRTQTLYYDSTTIGPSCCTVFS